MCVVVIGTGASSEHPTRLLNQDLVVLFERKIHVDRHFYDPTRFFGD